MVRLLIMNVSLHSFHQGWADAERRVSFLPFKTQSMLAEPARGIGFKLLDSFGDWKSRLQTDQQMYVVGSPANGYQHCAEIFAVPIK